MNRITDSLAGHGLCQAWHHRSPLADGPLPPAHQPTHRGDPAVLPGAGEGQLRIGSELAERLLPWLPAPKLEPVDIIGLPAGSQHQGGLAAIHLQPTAPAMAGH